MIEKIWWSVVPNSAKYINDIVGAFTEGKSVVCVLPEKCEWLDTMREILLEKIHSGINKTHVISGSDVGDVTPGEYLAEMLVKKDIRTKYRTSIGYEAFLTRIESETALIHSYIYLRDMTDEQTAAWLQFIAGYNKNHSPDSPRCKFIIETTNSECRDFSLGCVIKWNDYFRNYDINILCMLVSSDMNISDHFRDYLIELAVSCSENDPELASLLIEKGEKFIKDPEKILHQIVSEEIRSNAETFTLPDEMPNRIWKAQNRVFFPLIEQYRLNFIKMHENDFPLDEIIINSVGEEIVNIWDYELNTLKWLHDNCKLSLKKQEVDDLKFFKQCRNELAHLKVLEYSKLQRISGAV